MKRRNVRQYKNPDDRGAYLGGVYFIASDLYVKIGVSDDVVKTLRDLQEENPDISFKLLGYVPGGDNDLEKEIFIDLIDFHIGGGWFEWNDDLGEWLDWFDEDSSLREGDGW